MGRLGCTGVVETALVVCVAVTACGDSPVPEPRGPGHDRPPDAASPLPPCAPGTVRSGDACVVVGAAAWSDCPPGTVPPACAPPGVPPDACAEGFEPDEARGCRPVFEPDCPEGTFARPGAPTCEPVDPCDRVFPPPAPPGASVRLVAPDDPDAYPTLDAAVGEAEDGDVVAIAPGTYDERVAYQGKTLHFVGACAATTTWGGSALDLAHLAGGAAATFEGLTFRPRVRGIVVQGAGRLAFARTAFVGGEIAVVVADGVITEEPIVVDHCSFRNVAALHADARSVTVRDSAFRNDLDFQRQVVSQIRAAGASRIERSAFRNAVVHLDDLEATVERSAWAYDGLLVGTALLHLGLADAAAQRRLVVRDSTFTTAGNLALGSEGSLLAERVTVRSRGTFANANLPAVHALNETRPDDGVPRRIEIRDSAIEAAYAGMFVNGHTDLVLERSYVRTLGLPAVASLGIFGAPTSNVLRYADSPEHLRARIVDSEIACTTAIGLSVVGGTLDLEHVLVDAGACPDARPREPWAVGVDALHRVGVPPLYPALSVRGSRLRGAVALFVKGAEGELEATDLLVDRSVERPVRAVSVQLDTKPSWPSTLRGRRLRVESGSDFGLFVEDSAVALEASTVEGTRPEPGGDFGDGIFFGGAFYAAHVDLVDVRIAGSARGGLFNGGGDAHVATSIFECNGFDLGSTRSLSSLEPRFTDAGGNQCGCEGRTTPCAQRAAETAPPPALAPVLP